MNIQEYEQVKNFTYLEYCDYLQKKYGIGLCDYMTKSWGKNQKCSRTKDGLFAHHKFEDHAIRLSDKEYAMKNPYEWQLAENIVYCDYLEHLFLHILICENPAYDKNENEVVGIGGILQYIVPELNDLCCQNLVANDKEVYFILLKRFKTSCENYPTYKKDCLCISLYERRSFFAMDKWSEIFRMGFIKDIYKQIRNL